MTQILQVALAVIALVVLELISLTMLGKKATNMLENGKMVRFMDKERIPMVLENGRETSTWGWPLPIPLNKYKF